MTRTTAELRTDGDAIRRRILAYVADVVVVVGAIALLERAGGRRLSVRAALRGLAVAGLVAGPYHVLLEGATGQTPGKRLLGLAVVRADGEPCTYRAAAVRTLFRFVDWLPVAYATGLASMVLDGRHRRLGDRAAGTVVVRTDDRGHESGATEVSRR